MRRKSKKGLYLAIGGLIGIAAIGYFVYTSQAFERQKPKIAIQDKIYWNLKKPLKLTLTDDSGIKSYTVVMSDGKQKETIDTATLSNPSKKIDITIKQPAMLEFPQNRVILSIDVQDKSFWNYFLGNRAHKDVKIIIDRQKPDLFIVANSYSITKGGSALVVFHCSDENLDSFYIKTNFGKRFLAQPFYKDGYYVALIAWPIMRRSFRADIVAFDKAGNKSRAHVPLYLKNRRYKKSVIHLTENFLKGKVESLAEDYPETKGMSPLEKFKFINETLRQKNEELIHRLSSSVPKQRIESFDIRPFYPLKNAAPVASFGDHRFYYYKGRLVSESYHLGLDLASVKQAPVRASNPGEVVFANYNGIYGNMPLISHGLGLYTLYGHCSTLFVKKGDKVRRDEVIAKTGRTGLALGDHLHFGVLVQGIEVRPAEWMDKRWIKDHITTIMKEAKKVIDSE